MDDARCKKLHGFDLLGRNLFYSIHSCSMKSCTIHQGWSDDSPPNVGGSLNALDKCAVCKGANLISMVWNFKGMSRCNCLTQESINHCSVRSSCNFFPNAGIYFPSILFFFSFNLARSFERLIATIFKNNKLVSHVAMRELRNTTELLTHPPHHSFQEGQHTCLLRLHQFN